MNLTSKRRRYPAPTPSPRFRPRFTFRLLFTRVSTLIPLVLTLFILGFIAFGNLFHIKSITCHLNQGSCNPLQQKLLSKYLHRHIFTLKLDQIRRQMLNFDPSLTLVTANLVFPNTLTLDLHSDTLTFPINLVRYQSPLTLPVASSSATPSATLELVTAAFPATSNAPFKTVYLSSSGKLLDSSPSPSSLSLTPTILTDTSLPNTSTLISLYSYLKLINELSLDPSILWLYHATIGIKLYDNLIVLINPSMPAQDALTSLQQIRSESTIKLDRAIIDLRFNNPVILYQQSPTSIPLN